MDVGWLFLIGSAIVGLTGMIGLRRKRAICLFLSGAALPVLLFAALWMEIAFSDITSYFCIIAFLVLCGLRKKIE